MNIETASLSRYVMSWPFVRKLIDDFFRIWHFRSSGKSRFLKMASTARVSSPAERAAFSLRFSSSMNCQASWLQGRPFDWSVSTPGSGWLTNCKMDGKRAQNHNIKPWLIGRSDALNGCFCFLLVFASRKRKKVAKNTNNSWNSKTGNLISIYLNILSNTINI